MMIKSKIISKINNFVDNISLYKSFDGIINFMVKHNILSIDIHDIVNGTKNKWKFIFSSLNCAFMMLMSLMIIPFLLSDKLMDLIDNPIVPINKRLIGLMFFSFSFIINLRIVFLLEEKRCNLIWLKFIYHLMVNNQSKHKLNKKNYKMFKMIAKT